MEEIKIWHNPRCSKSRNTMALLEEKNIQAKVNKYLETNPSFDEIKDALNKLNISANDLLRKGEAIYKELGLKDIQDENTLINAMVENPKLIERPIIIRGEKAVIARPIENLEELLK